MWIAWELSRAPKSPSQPVWAQNLLIVLISSEIIHQAHWFSWAGSMKSDSWVQVHDRKKIYLYAILYVSVKTGHSLLMSRRQCLWTNSSRNFLQLYQTQEINSEIHIHLACHRPSLALQSQLDPKSINLNNNSRILAATNTFASIDKGCNPHETSRHLDWFLHKEETTATQFHVNIMR